MHCFLFNSDFDNLFIIYLKNTLEKWLYREAEKKEIPHTFATLNGSKEAKTQILIFRPMFNIICLEKPSYSFCLHHFMPH